MYLADAKIPYLNNHTGEEDVLLGLYDKHISKQAYTRQALASELRGDHVSALQIYNEATEKIEEVTSPYCPLLSYSLIIISILEQRVGSRQGAQRTGNGFMGKRTPRVSLSPN